jgi:hypothetical protein
MWMPGEGGSKSGICRQPGKKATPRFGNKLKLKGRNKYTTY